VFDSLEVEVLYPTGWRWRVSQAQGRHREVGSEGSVQPTGEPMNQNRRIRPTVPGERARDRDAHFHQGHWW